MCAPYRHAVKYSVFDVNCFPFHVAVPCRMSFQLRFSLSCKFSPWQPDVLCQLPRDLLMLFCAIIFRCCAVDKKITTRIEKALMRGVGLKAVADDIRENHWLYFYEMEAR